MGKDPGRSLRTVSKVMFILSIIGSVILAIMCFTEAREYSTYSKMYGQLRTIGFVILIVCPLISYIQLLVYDAIGKMTENTEYHVDYLRSIDKNIALLNKKVADIEGKLPSDNADDKKE